MPSFYQNLPEIIDPIAFVVGFIHVRWYSLMYMVGFLVVIGLLRWRVAKGEGKFEWGDVIDFLIYSFVGALLGGRLGYVIFYNLDYFIKNPLEIISPVNSVGDFVGIFGMSYFGSVIGVAIVAYFFIKRRRLNFWELLDFILPAFAAGYFLGRIGNFLNGELYGRITESSWGMFFGDKNLRHPSQLYEAFFEGFILFFVLWIIRNSLKDNRGMIVGIYLIGYGLFRFIIEFFREPDIQLGFIFSVLTLGQIFSVLMMILGVVIFKKAKEMRL